MVEGPDFFLAAFAGLPFVESALGFIAQNSASNHLRQEFRRDKNVALVVIRQGFVKVLDYVCANVKPDEIKRAKGCALGTAHGLSSDLVDFFDQ